MMPKVQKKRKITVHYEVKYGKESVPKRRVTIVPGNAIYGLCIGKKAPWEKVYSNIFTTLVREAFHSKPLRTKLRSFYAEHRASLDGLEKGASRRHINLKLDDLDIGFASTLAFHLFGKGNISLLFRVMMRYHAIRKGLLPAPRPSRQKAAAVLLNKLSGKHDEKLAPVQPRSNPVSGDDSVKSLYSISRETDEQLTRLMIRLQEKKMVLVRKLIERAVKKSESPKIIAFYERNKDRFEVTKKNSIPLRLNLPPETDGFLHLLAKKMFPTGRKRSIVLRIIVAYYAREYGLTRTNFV